MGTERRGFMRLLSYQPARAHVAGNAGACVVPTRETSVILFSISTMSHNPRPESKEAELAALMDPTFGRRYMLATINALSQSGDPFYIDFSDLRTRSMITRDEDARRLRDLAHYKRAVPEHTDFISLPDPRFGPDLFAAVKTAIADAAAARQPQTTDVVPEAKL